MTPLGTPEKACGEAWESVSVTSLEVILTYSQRRKRGVVENVGIDLFDPSSTPSLFGVLQSSKHSTVCSAVK